MDFRVFFKLFKIPTFLFFILLSFVLFSNVLSQELRPLNIAVLLATHSYLKPRSEYLQSFWKAVDLALSEFNPLAKSQGFEFHILKDEYSRRVKNEEEDKAFDYRSAVLNATLRFVQTPVHGIIGPHLRYFSVSSVDVATLFRIPFCNPDASIPVLKDLTKYPYAFDASPPLSDFAESFIQLIKHFGWKKFLLLHSFDPFSYGIATSVMNLGFEHPELDFQTLPFAEKLGNQTELNVIVDKLLASTYRVVIVSSVGLAFNDLFDLLDKRGVFDTGRTFFFLGNITMFYEQKRSPSELTRVTSNKSPLRGMFSLMGGTTNNKMKSLLKFEKKWTAMYPGSSDFELGVETYVCAATMMLGLLKQKNISSLSSFSEFLNVSDWEGPGGPLKFNEKNSLGSHMFLFNWQNAGLIEVAEFNPNAPPLSIRQPMFLHGSRVPPSDSPELRDITVYWDTVAGWILIGVCSVLGLVCLACIWVYAAHGHHFLLKPASPLYILWMLIGLIFLLGCIVSQLFVEWHWGCHFTLLIGLLGMSWVMGPLLAKHFLILQVYEVPLKGGGGRAATPVVPNSSKPASSSFKWFAQKPRFFFMAAPSWLSPFLPSKPNLLALGIFLVYAVLGILYVFLTPLEGEMHGIDNQCQAYLCLPKSHTHEIKEVYSNETTSNPLFYLLVLYHVMLILTMLWMSWDSQKVTEKKIKFTRDLGITAYVVALIGSLLFLSWVLDELLYPISFWVRSIGLLFLVTLYLTLYVIPPIWRLHRHHQRFRVCQRHIDPPVMTKTMSTTTTLPSPGACPYVYDGRWMYALPPRYPRWLRWISLFQHSWTWVQVQVVPQYKFIYLVDLDLGLTYQRIHRSSSSKRRFPTSSTSPSWTTLFQLETRDNVIHTFWTSSQSDTEKWVQILRS